MQAIWNSDQTRLNFLCLETIECADKGLLLKAEQKHLDQSGVGKNPLCMNILLVANSHLGVKRRPESIEKLRKVHIGRKASEETKAKQRAAKLGVKQSPEHIAKRTGQQKGKSCNRPKGVMMYALRKLTNDQVSELRKLKIAGVTYANLKNMYGIGIGTIQKIINRQSYADVE
jgi:isopropylmalate/homocitrate/citramalate synthase